LQILAKRPDALEYGKDKLLEAAVSRTKETTVRSLLTKGVNYEGSRDLLSSAMTLSMLQLLLGYGFQPKNSKALYHAVDRRDVEFAKCLIEYGADVDDRDMNGRTLLMVAVSTSSKEMVSVLLDANADLHAKNTST
jgi:ankyrin repeat protein